MRALRFEPEARAELRAAARWYDERAMGMAARLLDEVEAAVHAIEEQPRQFARVAVIDDSLEIRRCVLRRFPYAVVYLVRAELLSVIAVAHLRREPGYWLCRVPSEATRPAAVKLPG